MATMVAAAADIILKFEIVEGRNPSAESVAEAIAAFVDVLRTSAHIVEPGSNLSVEMVGVEPGSQMFKLALRKIHEFVERVEEGGNEFPLFKKALIALGSLIGGTVVVVSITNSMTPDPRIPADQMAVFAEMNKHLEESVELQKDSARFWGIVHEEPAFEQVGVLNGHDRSVIYQIPRSEFAERSGLWSGDAPEIAATVERRVGTWDVILVKPVLLPEERRWTFTKDGVQFSALMTDKAVLQAIHDRTLPLQLAEGVSMKIEVQYRERLVGDAWIPVPGSHRVRRVITPAPPASSLPLFSAPDGP